MKLKLFNKQRDEMLRKLDMDEYVRFMRVWMPNIPCPPVGGWAKPDVPMASMHKARLQIINFTPEEKLFSAHWLVDNGYSLPPPLELVDGKLVGAEYAH